MFGHSSPQSGIILVPETPVAPTSSSCQTDSPLVQKKSRKRMAMLEDEDSSESQLSKQVSLFPNQLTPKAVDAFALLDSFRYDSKGHTSSNSSAAQPSSAPVGRLESVYRATSDPLSSKLSSSYSSSSSSSSGISKPVSSPSGRYKPATEPITVDSDEEFNFTIPKKASTVQRVDSQTDSRPLKKLRRGGEGMFDSSNSDENGDEAKKEPPKGKQREEEDAEEEEEEEENSESEAEQEDVQHESLLVQVLDVCVQTSDQLRQQLESMIDTSVPMDVATVESTSSSTTEEDSTRLLGTQLKATETDSTDGSERKLITDPYFVHPKLALKPYQLVGINWLYLLYRRQENGILADEMGLGKTVQTIAFLSLLSKLDAEYGPHLIVVPASTLDNWVKELERWTPDLYVFMYHGSKEQRIAVQKPLRTDPPHVLLTTYNTCSQKHDRHFLKSFDFTYVILDEAHSIKNAKSARHKHLHKMRAQHRLLLTGTPIQNNLKELMVLLDFIMPSNVSNTTRGLSLPELVERVSKESAGQILPAVKKILAPYVLRRLKREVLDQLMPKVLIKKECELTEKQRSVYNMVLQQSRKTWNEFEQQQQDGKTKTKTKITTVSKLTNNILMELRKAANHPLLLQSIYTETQLSEIAKLLKKRSGAYDDLTHSQVIEELAAHSDFELHHMCCQYKFLSPYRLSNEQLFDSAKLRVLESLLPQLKAEQHRILLFSQFTSMLDILESYLEETNCKFLRLDGSTPVAERQQLIDQFNSDPEIFVFLLSTKAGGVGINLAAADTVIMHDLDFNPQNDRQAEDRAHRIGQLKTVTVYKLVSKGTVDENILKIAEGKLQLDQSLLDDNGQETASVKDTRRLRDLLHDVLDKST